MFFFFSSCLFFRFCIDCLNSSENASGKSRCPVCRTYFQPHQKSKAHSIERQIFQSSSKCPGCYRQVLTTRHYTRTGSNSIFINAWLLDFTGAKLGEVYYTNSDRRSTILSCDDNSVPQAFHQRLTAFLVKLYVITDYYSFPVVYTLGHTTSYLKVWVWDLELPLFCCVGK